MAAQQLDEKPAICEPGGRGFVFPLVPEENISWPYWLRAVLYILALCWIFLGVAIIADKFVNSIEAITSKKLRRLDRSYDGKTGGRFKTEKMWNATVANLTLMALGSSAPEILLSIIETVKNGFHAGELGPSTIVGSAAFNLFMIIAVCIVSVPAPGVRKIEKEGVFAVTAIFSIVAYLWLVMIVSVITPDVIEIWEGVITFLMMPALVLMSYLVDVKATKDEERREHLEKAQALDSIEIVSDADPQLRRANSPSEGHRAPESLDIHEGGRRIANPHGVITFDNHTAQVTGTGQRQVLPVVIYRRNGHRGKIVCQYKTEKLSAVPGRDYEEIEGEAVFEDGDQEFAVELTILQKKIGESSDQFQFVLEHLQGGAVFDPNQDPYNGKSLRQTISISNEYEALTKSSLPLKVVSVMDRQLNFDAIAWGTRVWAEEIQKSICMIHDDPEEEVTTIDRIMHLISLPWNFLFAVVVPPPIYAGGWICFIFSLAVIGLLTSVVCDFAELLGCVLAVKDSIVAITFVALGTSMPDLFASKTAAVQDPTADASIVNVTGSNSVNVFLGIGLPWAMAAVYWSVIGATPDWKRRYPEYVDDWPKGAFIVKGGDLGFSVTVFSVCAVIALAVIRGRRIVLGAELGGDPNLSRLSFIVLSLLWIYYIVLSVWKAYSPNVSGIDQVWMIFKSLFMLQIVCLVIYGVLLMKTREHKGASESQACKESAREDIQKEPLGLLEQGGPGTEDQKIDRSLSFAHYPLRDIQRHPEKAPEVMDVTHWAQGDQPSMPGENARLHNRSHSPAFGVDGHASPAGPPVTYGAFAARAADPTASVMGASSASGPGASSQSFIGNEALLHTVTIAAMTSWAAVKMREQAKRAQAMSLERHAQMPEDSQEPDVASSPRESFCSVGEFGTPQHVPSRPATPTPLDTPRRRNSVSDALHGLQTWAGDHAADWVALWVAGWLATQASHPEGRLFGQ